MFFTLSKMLWFLMMPGNLLLLALTLAALLSFTRFKNAAYWILRLYVVVALFLAIVPIGTFMTAQLEDRFPQTPPLPEKINGIVILGGVISPMVSLKRGSVEFGSAVERITVGAQLARLYPDARVIFSGGSGDIFNPELREAHYAPQVFEQLGVPRERIVFDAEARNTAQNARITLELARQKPDEKWVLITSAFHMPRAVGTFRKAGWKIIPYPVDYGTTGGTRDAFTFSFTGGLAKFGGALHEYIGLLAYWITGRSDSWFPGPKE